MASLLKWLGKEADKIIPGDQSSWHKPAAPQQQQQQQVQQAQAQPSANPQAQVLSHLFSGGAQAVHHVSQAIDHNKIGHLLNSFVLDPIVTTDTHASQALQGKNPYHGTVKQQLGQAAQDAINVASVVPVGKGAGLLAKSAPSLGRKVYEGAKLGAVSGTAFGGAQGAAAAAQNNASNKDILKQAGVGAAEGGALGAGLGIAAPVAGAGVKAGVKGSVKLNNHLGQDGYIGGPNAKTYTDKQATGKLQGNSFETSDAKMKVKGKGAAKAEAGQTVPLSDVIKHPQLKQDYPHFFNKDSGLKVTVDPKAMQSTIDHNTGLITIAKAQAPHLNTPTGQARLMEEIQHSVDDHEGRVSGTTPAIEKIHAQPEEVKQAARVASTLRPQVIALQDLVRRGNMTKQEFEAHPTVQAFKRTTAVAKSAPALTDQQAMERYLANESEIRAKSVADRRGMSQKQIDQNPITPEQLGLDNGYRSAHQIDTANSSPAHSLNLNGLINEVKQTNGYLTKYDQADLRKLQKLQGNPEADVTIYRASPKNEINTGDWVTTSRDYANDIKRQNGGKVYSYTVKAKDLHYPNNIDELPSLAKFSAFAYSPENKVTHPIFIPQAREPQPRVAASADEKLPIAPQTLNTNRLNISEDAKGEVNALSAPDELQHLSNKDVEQFSKQVGIDTRSHNIEEQRNIIARQLNLRKDIVTMTNQADRLLEDGDLSGRAQLLKQIAEMGRTSTEQGSSVARQLQARRILANELDTPMQRVFKLLDAAGVNPDLAAEKMAGVDFNDANAVVRAYRELVPPKKGEWLDTLRYNSMLSSPLTQINNIVPNILSTAGVTPVEKTLTGVIDAIKSAATGAPREHMAGEGAAYAKGYFKSFGEAKRRFSDSLSGKSEAANLDMKGHVPMYAHGQNHVYDTLSFPMRLMEAMDGFFTGLTEGGVTKALEYRASKGVNVKNIENTASAESAYRLYRQQLGDDSQGHFLKALDIPAQKLMELRNSKNPYVALPAKFTVPFVRTTMNIFKQGFEYSPAGVVTLHGSANKTEQLSKMVLGTAVTGAAAALLGHNRLTWAQPTNQKQKEAWQAAGMQPYSVKIGNNWVSFQKLPPALSFNLALIAALDDAHKNSKINQNGIDNALTAISKYGQFLSDQSYTKSAGNFLKAVQGDPQATTQLISSYPQQLVPGRALMNWIATATDNTQRKVNKDAPIWKQQVEALEQVIPGLRKTTTALTGPDGAPIPAQHPLINAVSPAKISTEEPAGADYYGMLKQKSLDDSNKRITKAEAKKNGVDVKASTDSTDSTAATDDKMQTRLDNANKKLPKGISDGSKGTLLEYARLTDKGKAVFESDPKKVYNLHSAQYEQDKLSGKLSTAEDFKKQKALRTESITSNYSKDVTEMRGMSKGDLQAFLNANPDKQKLVNQVLELDQKLANASGTKTKFGGTVATKAKGRKGTGVKVAKAKKAKNPAMPSYGKQAGVGSLLRNSVLKGIKAPANKKPHQAAKPKIAKIKMSGKGSSRFA